MDYCVFIQPCRIIIMKKETKNNALSIDEFSDVPQVTAHIHWFLQDARV